MKYEDAIKKLREDAKKETDIVQVWKDNVFLSLVKREEAEDMVKNWGWKWDGSYRIVWKGGE